MIENNLRSFDTKLEERISINKIINSKLIEELNPSDKTYLYAEERRLFYVALTRTKNKVYILVPLFNKSIFIKELKKIIHFK